MGEYIEANRQASTPFEIVVEGTTPGDDRTAASEILRPWIAAGATWWTETMWESIDDPNRHALIQRRIRQGPPHG